VPLPAFAAARRAAAAPAVQQSIDISYPSGPQQQTRRTLLQRAMGSKNVSMQLSQYRFPGLAISNAKILIYFSNKIYGSNFSKEHSETVMV